MCKTEYEPAGRLNSKSGKCRLGLFIAVKCELKLNTDYVQSISPFGRYKLSYSNTDFGSVRNNLSAYFRGKVKDHSLTVCSLDKRRLTKDA